MVTETQIEKSEIRFSIDDRYKILLIEIKDKIRHSRLQAAIDKNKTTNFLQRLPAPKSKLAQELIKNPYSFDFLGLHDEAYEREIEVEEIEAELNEPLHTHSDWKLGEASNL